MKRIESIEDIMRGIVTYEMSDGTRVALDARQVRNLGLTRCLRLAGVPREPSPSVVVMQDGIAVGTLPSDFDPSCISSGSWLYAPRHGDFKMEAGKWMAASTLGFGDLLAIPGFIPC